MKKLKCNRCGYKWIPRIYKKPCECPSCKRRDWSK